MGIDFSSDQFVISDHAVQRWCSDRVSPLSDRVEALEGIKQNVSTGDTFLTVNNHRYIKNGELFFPCAKIMPNIYVVKTVLKWNMVEQRMTYLKHLFG